jgi:hypothetical protein
MSPRRSLAALAAAGLAMGTAACALDFGRFDATGDSADASLAPTADSSNEVTQVDASTEVAAPDAARRVDASVADGGAADARALADGAEEASCTPSPSCLGSAQTCGAVCAQQEQQCAVRCGGGGVACRATCSRTESTCFKQCDDTCSTCVRSAGCGAVADCAAR